MTESGLLLEARALSVGYGGRVVLSGIDLSIASGELWFLLGPNGAGKTTLLGTLLGLLPPLSGAVRRAPALAGGRCVGFLSQRAEWDPSIPTTVAEFVALGTAGLDLAPAARRDNVAWALARTGLQTQAREDLRSLSGGQRRRAFVARALARRPPLLILDEPTAGWDPPSRDGFLRLIADLNRRERLAVVVTTHDAAAAAHATHAALLAGGRCIAGPVASVLTPADLARAYGAPPGAGMDRPGEGGTA